jgi:hypothetical protein
LVGSIFILAAAVIGLRATNTRGEEPERRDEPSEPVPDALPQPVLS